MTIIKCWNISYNIHQLMFSHFHFDNNQKDDWYHDMNMSNDWYIFQLLIIVIETHIDHMNRFIVHNMPYSNAKKPTQLWFHQNWHILDELQYMICNLSLVLGVRIDFALIKKIWWCNTCHIQGVQLRLPPLWSQFYNI